MINLFKGMRGAERDPDATVRDFMLSGIDANQGAAEIARESFGSVPNSRNRAAGTKLDDRETNSAPLIQVPLQAFLPVVKTFRLCIASRVVPIRVAKHEDVRSRENSATRALRQRPFCTHGLLIDVDRQICRGKDLVPTRTHTLEMMDRAVCLNNLFDREPRLLKLAVDVRGEDKAAQRARIAPSFQDRKPLVRDRLSI